LDKTGRKGQALFACSWLAIWSVGSYDHGCDAFPKWEDWR
jgi:hypothetical protein